MTYVGAALIAMGAIGFYLTRRTYSNVFRYGAAITAGLALLRTNS